MSNNLNRPKDSLNKKASFDVIINGIKLNKKYRINKILTKKEINKISRASIEIYGGDRHKNEFPEIEDSIFTPINLNSSIFTFAVPEFDLKIKPEITANQIFEFALFSDENEKPIGYDYNNLLSFFPKIMIHKILINSLPENNKLEILCFHFILNQERFNTLDFTEITKNLYRALPSPTTSAASDANLARFAGAAAAEEAGADPALPGLLRLFDDMETGEEKICRERGKDGLAR